MIPALTGVHAEVGFESLDDLRSRDLHAFRGR